MKDLGDSGKFGRRVPVRKTKHGDHNVTNDEWLHIQAIVALLRGYSDSYFVSFVSAKYRY